MNQERSIQLYTNTDYSCQNY